MSQKVQPPAPQASPAPQDFVRVMAAISEQQTLVFDVYIVEDGMSVSLTKMNNQSKRMGFTD